MSAGSARMFDGPWAAVVAKLMARGNRDAEAEAIALLGPAPDSRVLAAGFGPGVGIELLVPVVPRGFIGGIDPSRAMLREATRRNQAAIAGGLVRLARATADDIPWPDGSFDAVLAVNSVQLWQPFDRSIAETARVLRPGGRLISLTHDWAIRKSTGHDVADWARWATTICHAHGLTGTDCRRARAENGRSVAFTATRRA